MDNVTNSIPSQKQLNDVLITKRGGAHDDVTGKRVKRAKIKEQARKQVEQDLTTN